MTDPSVTTIKACRVCKSAKLDTVLSLGDQYVPDFITAEGKSPKAPLELVRCQSCGLIQLRHTFSRASLYRHYWYKSGISPTMRRALSDLAAKALAVAHPKYDDIVVDIGCNDGTLLRSYNTPGLKFVGFEPAENLAPEARKGTDWVFNDFFNARTYTQKFADKKAKIITSVAMFYDLEDPNSFVADVTRILAPDGVWIVQQNYLATMLQHNGFDNIGHEHLEYYTLGTMRRLLERHGLQIFEVDTNDVNGGSFRTFICHKGRYPEGNSVSSMEKHEAHLGLDEHATYEKFAANISKIKSQLHQFVAQEVKRGKTVYVYGASNRGNTILQYCGLDHQLIRKAADANPEKWGLKTAGTLISIVSKEEARKDHPDYFLVLPHHFLEEIKREERQYLRSGGKLVVPLPEFRVLQNDD